MAKLMNLLMLTFVQLFHNNYETFAKKIFAEVFFYSAKKPELLVDIKDLLGLSFSVSSHSNMV